MELPTVPGATFMVHVTPGASNDAYLGYDAARKVHLVRVTAQADNGKANAAVVSLLRAHGVRCVLVSGFTSRRKRFRVL